jgi:hypothetical protein
LRAQQPSDLKVDQTFTAFSTAWCWWLDKRFASFKAGASVMMGQAPKCLFSHGWVGKSLTKVEYQTQN